MNELHGQIVTLRLVKTGGALMKNLEKKLQDVSDKLSQATIDLCGARRTSDALPGAFPRRRGRPVAGKEGGVTEESRAISPSCRLSGRRGAG